MITRILLTSYPWLASFSVTDESDTFFEEALRFAFHPKPSRQMAVNSQAFPNDLIGSSGSMVGAVCTLRCCYLKHPSLLVSKEAVGLGEALHFLEGEFEYLHRCMVKPWPEKGRIAQGRPSAGNLGLEELGWTQSLEMDAVLKISISSRIRRIILH